MLQRVRRSVVWRAQRRLDPWVIARFHAIFYRSGVWGRNRWRGVPVYKNPLDLFIFEEIISETRPELIVETGTNSGGSALYLASVCELLGGGEVVSIDIEDEKDTYPAHRLITYLGGRSSTDPDVIDEIAVRAEGRRTMVVLDSDHSQRHVEAELRAYAPLVSEGCYLIVEDSNIGPIRADLLPGPMQAIETFLRETTLFEADRERERFFVTFNPSGYLRRLPAARA
jgi:cephalosporin hydroxylase